MNDQLHAPDIHMDYVILNGSTERTKWYDIWIRWVNLTACLGVLLLMPTNFSIICHELWHYVLYFIPKNGHVPHVKTPQLITNVWLTSLSPFIVTDTVNPQSCSCLTGIKRTAFCDEDSGSIVTHMLCYKTITNDRLEILGIWKINTSTIWSSHSCVDDSKYFETSHRVAW
jgi:hypothetical protein